MDGLSRHELMSIPTGKGGVVGLGGDQWHC